MLEDPTAEQVEQNLAYLKGARSDPLPWEDQGGSPTGPMAALTPPVLAELDRTRPDPLPQPQRPAQRLTRMQEREQRKAMRKRFGFALSAAGTTVFVLAFIVAYLFL